MKIIVTLYILLLSFAATPLFLLAAPWGTKLDGLGFYFYRANSWITIRTPIFRTTIINWETGWPEIHQPHNR